MYSRTRGYLPHIQDPNGTYFLTFRLSDSLPASLLLRWKEELEFRKRGAKDENEICKLTYDYQSKVQTYLDTSAGQCWLRIPQIGSLVDGALRFYDRQRYDLLAWTIMPNHVHVLVKLNGTYSLSSLMHSWKGFTAKEANRLLKRTGEFWQREYFDRLMTSNRQIEFVLRYILNNPVKAGLCEYVSSWPWNRCSEEMKPLANRFFIENEKDRAGEDAGGR